jgi:ATP-dependent DNA helicase RecG
MLTQQQLIGLLTDIEADYVERTTSTTKTDKFAEAICAFANDLPKHGHAGYLIVGATDGGSLSGLTVTDELLKNLAAIRSDGNVQPLPAMTVQKYVLDGGELAVVEVQPSDLPPVRYKGRAYIQYLRLPAADLTDPPDDQAEVSGDLASVVREMEFRLKLLIQTKLRPVSGMQERLVPDYPEWALRELLMNAVMHRNYDSNSPIRCYAFSDHIEIMSPGGLYGEATPENFPTRNSYRNPVIAEAMKSLGFVNRFGYGVQRAQGLLADNGNPRAKFDFDANSVLVRVYRRPE